MFAITAIMFNLLLTIFGFCITHISIAEGFFGGLLLAATINPYATAPTLVTAGIVGAIVIWAISIFSIGRWLLGGGMSIFWGYAVFVNTGNVFYGVIGFVVSVLLHLASFPRAVGDEE